MTELVKFYKNKVEIATESELLEFCNRVRKAGGGDILPALLPGVPSSANTCLIARNLNFECSVTRGSWDKTDNWSMFVDDLEIGARIASKLRVDCRIHYRDSFWVEVKLPVVISNSAKAFDKRIAYKNLIEVMIDNTLVYGYDTGMDNLNPLYVEKGVSKFEHPF